MYFAGPEGKGRIEGRDCIAAEEMAFSHVLDTAGIPLVGTSTGFFVVVGVKIDMSLDIALVRDGRVVILEIDEHVHFVDKDLEYLQTGLEGAVGTGGDGHLGSVQLGPVGEITVDLDRSNIFRLRILRVLRIFRRRGRFGGLVAGNGECGQEGHQDVNLFHDA